MSELDNACRAPSACCPRPRRALGPLGSLCALYVALLGLMLAAGCSYDKPGDKPGAAAPSAQAVDVAVHVMAPQNVLYTTELAGRVAPYKIAEVRPQVSGIIQKRLFEEGADVAAGQVLYQIDPSEYEAELANARANLAVAEANVAPARLKMERFRDLVASNAVSRQEYEDAQAAFKQASATAGARAAAVDTARIRLAYTRVTSPIAGRIGRSTVTPGALVTANQPQMLASVQQLDPVYVDLTQSSAELLRLRKNLDSGRLRRLDGAEAEVSLKLEDGTPYPERGTLKFTDVSVDQSTGAVNLRAVFPNPDQLLLPGAYVRAVLTEGRDENALLLPQEALLRDIGGNAQVLVVRPDGTAERRTVKVGRTHERFWVVTGGLEPGDAVIVEGVQRVRPGGKVRVVKAAPAAASGPQKAPGDAPAPARTSTS